MVGTACSSLCDLVPGDLACRYLNRVESDAVGRCVGICISVLGGHEIDRVHSPSAFQSGRASGPWFCAMLKLFTVGRKEV